MSVNISHKKIEKFFIIKSDERIILPLNYSVRNFNNICNNIARLIENVNIVYDSVRVTFYKSSIDPIKQSADMKNIHQKKVEELNKFMSDNNVKVREDSNKLLRMFKHSVDSVKHYLKDLINSEIDKKQQEEVQMYMIEKLTDSLSFFNIKLCLEEKREIIQDRLEEYSKEIKKLNNEILKLKEVNQEITMEKIRLKTECEFLKEKLNQFKKPIKMTYDEEIKELKEDLVESTSMTETKSENVRTKEEKEIEKILSELDDELIDNEEEDDELEDYNSDHDDNLYLDGYD